MLGPKLQGSGNQVNQDGWVEQGIGVIGHQKDRAFLGDGLLTQYLEEVMPNPTM